MKYKVGDRVRIVKCTYHTNCKYVGREFEIEKINEKAVNPYALKGCSELFRDEELELKQFTKSDLKDGDIVTYRDSSKAVILRQQKELRTIDTIGLMYLEDYAKGLKYSKNKRLDIIKVERPTQYETVFERKEEILDEAEKRYLSNIIKPFRNKVKFIEKSIDLSKGEFIEIGIKDDIDVMLPYFKNAMYKGMETNKQYTLEELGL